jgi:hypothetical protein
LPRLVHELGVRAHSDDVAAHFDEAIVLLCQSSEFGRSDEREICGIEEEDSPAFVLDLVLHAEFAEVAFRRLVRFELKIRHLRSEF